MCVTTVAVSSLLSFFSSPLYVFFRVACLLWYVVYIQMSTGVILGSSLDYLQVDSFCKLWRNVLYIWRQISANLCVCCFFFPHKLCWKSLSISFFYYLFCLFWVGLLGAGGVCENNAQINAGQVPCFQLQASMWCLFGRAGLPSTRGMVFKINAGSLIWLSQAVAFFWTIGAFEISFHTFSWWTIQKMGVLALIFSLLNSPSFS